MIKRGIIYRKLSVLPDSSDSQSTLAAVMVAAMVVAPGGDGGVGDSTDGNGW